MCSEGGGARSGGEEGGREIEKGEAWKQKVRLYRGWHKDMKDSRNRYPAWETDANKQ